MLEYLSQLITPIYGHGEAAVFMLFSLLVMLAVMLLLYKTYRASLRVTAQLNEFSSLSNDRFGGKLKLIEAGSDAYQLNRSALGPLARIVDEYCVATITTDGLITYVNERFITLTGLPQRELIGTREKFSSQSDSADAECTAANWAASIAQLKPERPWHGEICLGTPHGVRWLDCFVFPLSFFAVDEAGFMLFGSDISHLKNQNLELQHALQHRDARISQMEGILYNSEKMASLGVISAGIAHEINNPLAFVGANLKQIERHGQLLGGIASELIQRLQDDKLAAFLDSMPHQAGNKAALQGLIDEFPEVISETLDGVERIRKIVADLKFFSHDSQEDFTDIDVHHCVQLAINLARHETRKRVAIVSELPGGPCTVRGSETRLSQVFLNLIVNASQAMVGAGTITLRGSRQNDHYLIEVADDGPGIPAELLENIFEPFFTTKPAGQGTGLGLAISQDIMRRHGGSINVTSSPGEGTVFALTLPLQAPPQASSPLSSSPQASSQQASRTHAA